MELCALCGGAAARLVPAYWLDGGGLCPGCCRRVGETNDAKRRWPPVPWNTDEQVFAKLSGDTSVPGAAPTAPALSHQEQA